MESMLKETNAVANSVFGNAGGKLDAQAFKAMIYAKQAGSITGPKNSLAVALNSATRNDFLEDNVLLHGLKSFGITIDELL